MTAFWSIVAIGCFIAATALIVGYAIWWAEKDDDDEEEGP